MTLKTFAYKNIHHHRTSYSAYFLSCIFAVCVFYLYAALLFHPMLKKDIFPDSFLFLMYLVEIIVALFAFLFIGYSQSAFLRNRKQDIGLLQILGMPIRQVVRLIFWENISVGALALLIGLLTGLIGSKFFFLVVSFVLQLSDPIPVQMSFKAILFTTGFFFCLFLILSWGSRLTIQKQSISEVLREKAQEKRQPIFSVWLVFISLVSISVAYYLSFPSSFVGVIKHLIFIILLLLIGTYLGYTQLSVAGISLLERFPKWFYCGINMFLFSQLRYRLKDNARILFLVTIFTSIVLTSVGVSLTYYNEADIVGEEQAPYHLTTIDNPLNSKQIEQKLQAYRMKTKAHIQFLILALKTDDRRKNVNNPNVSIISNGTLNSLLKQAKKKPISIHAKQVVQIWNSGVWESGEQKQADSFTVQQGKQSFSLQWIASIKGVFFNEHDLTRVMWAVSDQTFRELQQAGQSPVHMVDGYQFFNPKQSMPLLESIQRYYQAHHLAGKDVSGTILVQKFFRDLFSPLLFVSVFIGMLFFLAAGSILYFRLYIELPSERKQVKLLHKLGLQQKQGEKIVVRQIQILFMLPFVVGTIHSLAALNLCSFLLHRPIYTSYFGLWVSYLLLGIIYYVWTKRQILRAL
ncbi:FtsX-like permease family protein [Shimazuella sp. AN120528]|uniref:FtsX-like permease family protein n=1 Tax=Shimazuella soli TaxID=1892854 RepID=UPI001F0E10B4|nr:FtsX-like permease family protein [Shimazuella soli]MCH5584768.1 FtsX-like permease family protein [Shimazuella soli]